MAFTTALYLRLSVDDDNRDESDSIANQRDLLTTYVATNPALSKGEILTFADDGWSGTNFERPQVKALLDLARCGGVQCIVVKDLSRWGRNYPEVSEFLDQIFPFLGIRFISLGEGYDSDTHKGQTVPMDVAFGTLMHDVYCKDLSVKVRQSYVAKTKNGEFLCGSPPFGFVKASSRGNRLEVDSEAADTVRRIFTLACDGKSNTQIAAVLNRDGVDTPLMYRKRKGRTLRGDHSAIGERVFWTSETVRKILVDERYAGVMVSGKKRIASPGSRKIEYLSESEWIRVPASHEAIVSEDVYKQANANIVHRKIATSAKNRSPFAGKIKCGCCGKSMQYATTTTPYFYCESPKFNIGLGCFDGRLYLSELSEVVLTTVKVETQKTLETLRKRKQQSHGTPSKDAINAELKKLSVRIALLERRSIALYEDFADGKIDKDDYLEAMTTNGDELQKTQIHIDELNSQLAAVKGIKAINDVADELGLQRVLNADIVNDEVLALIDRILIVDTERIEIRFTFGDTNTTRGEVQK